jgi:hypothetical protein
VNDVWCALGRVAWWAATFSILGCGESEAKHAELLCEAPCEFVAQRFPIWDWNVDETGLYIVHHFPGGPSTLTRVPHDGGPAMDLVRPECSHCQLELHGGRAYWIELLLDGGGLVSRVRSIASTGGEVATHFEHNDTLAWVRVDDDSIYVANTGGDPPFRIPLGGGDAVPYASLGPIGGFALDAGKLYFAAHGQDGWQCEVRSMPVTGGDSTLLYQGGLSAGDIPRCEADDLVAQAGRLFWAEGSPTEGPMTLKTLHGAAASPPVSLLTAERLLPSGVASDGTNVYLGVRLSDASSVVVAQPVDGGASRVLFRGRGGASPVRIAGGRAYFLMDDGDGTSAVLSVPK